MATKKKPARPDKFEAKVEIVGSCGGAGAEVELDKRTYLPGIEIYATCPKCGEEDVRDMAHSYLSYPKVGQTIDARGVCGNCDHEWPVLVVLRLTLEPAPAGAEVSDG